MTNKELSKEEVAEKLAQASYERINKIAERESNYYTLINNGLNFVEKHQLGLDMVMSGFKIIVEAAVESDSNLSDTIACIQEGLTRLNAVVNTAYLNEDNIAKMMANYKASQLDKNISTAPDVVKY